MSTSGTGSPATCRHCAAPVPTRPRPARIATAGGIRIAVPGREVGDCRRRHPHATELAAARRAVAGLARGRWRPLGPDRCGACPTRLDLPTRRTTRAVTVEPAAGAPFTLEIDLTLARCPDCAADNVPAAERIPLARVLRHVLAAD